ncbi:hypothetical protein [Rhodohalobacter sp.]|uniref:hypothetical protein n=1 Tax=Rhodohalobacter sp. TaxID=1974210 RepID=UPI002ACE14C2|nr:hypothetical protein [Rhodohalobacter sp.]MDZ7756760.1 hypothetical protein [Rhodohalobacter sp.]
MLNLKWNGEYDRWTDAGREDGRCFANYRMIELSNVEFVGIWSLGFGELGIWNLAA